MIYNLYNIIGLKVRKCLFLSADEFERFQYSRTSSKKIVEV